MTQTATFGGGCFWCVEAIFRQLRGVEKVISGYSGGSRPSPSYEAVSSGKSGHAEAVQVTFDPNVISYEQLLKVFFLTHDPTTPNQQGADIGPQYRSVIFYHAESQKFSAEQMIKKLEREKLFNAPIITELKPFEKFYPAEASHQNYYAQNPDKPYCQVVISPKLAKFRKKFTALLKK